MHLFGEGTEVWRPVEAEHLGEDRYRLVGSVPEDETWELQPGQVVRCREMLLPSGTVALVAFEAGGGEMHELDWNGGECPHCGQQLISCGCLPDPE